jgi:hydrogenase maturation protease
MKSTVVIGLGNPILSDDAVGVKVARLLKEELADVPGVEIKELYAGGMRVMDAIAGFDKAVIVDAMQTGLHRPGFIRLIHASELGVARNLASTHDTNLPTALALGTMLGLSMPHDVKVFGIEAQDVEHFSEALTGEVERSMPEAVRMIKKEVMP